jgi:hypothetical protein
MKPWQKIKNPGWAPAGVLRQARFRNISAAPTAYKIKPSSRHRVPQFGELVRHPEMHCGRSIPKCIAAGAYHFHALTLPTGRTVGRKLGFVPFEPSSTLFLAIATALKLFSPNDGPT